ncbi:hypothetical protein F5Y19DRAFT_439757 [Xylariaceae sp. FL1651]|nr:hypothetical protein F5Y19DRAFT_439757 [Xylariaceae sp. FL1651]
MEDMDVDNGSINDIAIREARDDSESISISRVESDLIANEQAESAESDNEVEMYQDDDIDKDYDDENVDNNIHSVVAESPTSRVSNRHQSSASLKNRKRSAREASNKALFTFGTTQQDVVGSGEDTAVGVNRKAIPYNINGISDEDSEVPSSVPRPSSAGEASAHRNATTTVSSGRKRVVKPDFFSRVVEEDDNKNDFQSPTAAALSRKKDKGKQVATLQYDTEAGPSVTNGKSKQPKITGVLGDNASVDGDDAGTPLTQSVVRLRTPKAPVTLSGVFSDFELRNLSQAIERYREDNGKTQYEVNELIHSNPKDSKTGELWECIMATCPGRSRQKVINQTRRRFHNFVARGTWTPEQEQELKQMYDQYGNKYALIGQLINRHPEDIRDRIRNYLICGDKQRKDQWSQEEQDQLIAIVEQAIAQIHQERVKRGDMSDRPVEEDINWQLVSQGMGRTRSRLQCISKWKAVKPQLAGGGLDGETAPIEEIIQKARETATTMSYRNRFLIVKAILRTGASADSRIPWLKVRTELSLKWTRPPLMVVWFRLRRTLPNWQTLNVKEICTLLIQNFQHTHMLEYPSEENSDLDFDAEYREIEYKIKRGRKSGTSAKSPAIVTKNNDDDDDEAIRDQLDATGEEATEEALVSHHHRRSSVDLGVGSIGEDEPEVEDSEPEVHTRRRRSTRSRGNHIELQEGVSDSQSSDTNASQVSSIPAR